jgi:triacylglycerol esterase/lipase EstA (alpha/beta hydrolase family)
MGEAIYLLAILLIVSLLLTTTGIATHFTLAHAQTSSCYNGIVMPTSRGVGAIHVPPVILIHGYIENAAAWSKWEPWLQHDGIPFCTASFVHSDDPCGYATDHANELSQIVQKVKDSTRENQIMSNQVNIVGHSKGGLDARMYLAQTGTRDVANLVMIGTPNGGDTLANDAANYAEFTGMFPFSQDWFNLFCRPALYDLKIGADATNSAENNNTKYYTIYGSWNPSLNNCPQPPASSVGTWAGFDWPELEKEGYFNLHSLPNDGIVPASSVEWLPHYRNHANLGFNSIHDCHTNLLSRSEYDLVKNILNPSVR